MRIGFWTIHQLHSGHDFRFVVEARVLTVENEVSRPPKLDKVGSLCISSFCVPKIELMRRRGLWPIKRAGAQNSVHSSNCSTALLTCYILSLSESLKG